VPPPQKIFDDLILKWRILMHTSGILTYVFLPRDASAERGDEIACRLSVRPSVRPSVCNDQVP